MPPPATPAPPPSQESKSAIQQALHDRDAPPHLSGKKDTIRKEANTTQSAENEVKERNSESIVDGKFEPAMTDKEGSEGGRRS
ncbi:hypothetical protein ABW19_dt0205650 [Dactylella cylindrospora]|nr:hypothetical protein ABW19_dt0205650 [Dactylella cylindrospora]